MTIEERVKRVISNQLGVYLTEVTPEALFIDDLGVDSLEMVELCMSLEEEFNIEFPDEDMEKMQKVEDMIRCIKDKMSS